MSNKNLDGIRRISGQELKRARRIILESIGERDNTEARKDSFKSIPRKGRAMDSLSASRAIIKRDPIQGKVVKPKQEKNKITQEKPAPNKKSSIVEEKIELSEKEKIAKQEVKAAAEREKVELKKKKEKEASKLAADKEKKKKIEKARKEKRLKKEIRREIRIMRWEKFKNLIKENWRKSMKFFCFSFLFIIVIMALLYLIFCLLLLKFNFDNSMTRRISEYVPVPAVVAKEGWIEYYDYLKMIDGLKNQYENGPELEQVKRDMIANRIVFQKLSERYDLNLAGKTGEEIVREINTNLTGDRKENEVSVSRIEKIKELVMQSEATRAAGGQGESFEEIGKKYSDEQGYWVTEGENSIFSGVLNNLAAGETSEILVADSGYYIFRKDEKGFKYIFVKSINFSKYLENLYGKMKFLVLTE
jgi:hypothetical protein